MNQIEIQRLVLSSHFLNREVIVDIYFPSFHTSPESIDLLLVNDGQDLERMNFKELCICNNILLPLVVVGIHASEERKMEYGVSGYPDYMGRGSRASNYAEFIIKELMLVITQKFPLLNFKRKYLAGFSLGGLMAFDMLMDYPTIFSSVGVFSGSFWWRSKSLEDGYKEEAHRIMHTKIRTKKKEPGLKFFIQTGQLDEIADRNNNGIIDSIDDALDIINELSKLGYTLNDNITYIELQDGRHDVETWSRVMPDFIKWLILNRN